MSRWTNAIGMLNRLLLIPDRPESELTMNQRGPNPSTRTLGLDPIVAFGLAGFQLALQLDPLAELAQVAFRGCLLGRGNVCAADSGIGVEALGASPFDRELGSIATRGSLFDTERRTLQRYPGTPGVDPFHARVAALVVDDMRSPAAIAGSVRIGLGFVVFHAPKYDRRRLLDI